MFRRTASPFRILLLLVIFLASSAGHHAAIAASSPRDIAVEVSTRVHDPSAYHHDSCGSGRCFDYEESCCVTGQCMLALAPRADVALLGTMAGRAPAAASEATWTDPFDLPFRPPAV